VKVEVMTSQEKAITLCREYVAEHEGVSRIDTFRHVAQVMEISEDTVRRYHYAFKPQEKKPPNPRCQMSPEEVERIIAMWAGRRQEHPEEKPIRSLEWLVVESGRSPYALRGRLAVAGLYGPSRYPDTRNRGLKPMEFHIGSGYIRTDKVEDGRSSPSAIKCHCIRKDGVNWLFRVDDFPDMRFSVNDTQAHDFDWREIGR
jgi:hypothetical protein